MSVSQLKIWGVSRLIYARRLLSVSDLSISDVSLSDHSIIIIIIIITKIYIAHMPDRKINHQIESEAHKKVDITNI